MTRTKGSGEPHFTHNCENCAFVNSFLDETTSTIYDIWVHPSLGGPTSYATVLLRYGDNDENYYSSPLGQLRDGTSPRWAVAAAAVENFL